MRPIFIITLLALVLSALTGCSYEKNYYDRGHDHRYGYSHYDHGHDYYGYRDDHRHGRGCD